MSDESDDPKRPMSPQLGILKTTITAHAHEALHQSGPKRRRFTKAEILRAAKAVRIPSWVDERGLKPVEARVARKRNPESIPSRQVQYVMEKRSADGTLDLTEPQPPFAVCTYDRIADYYFQHHPSSEKDPILQARETASQEEILKWYADQGFVWRPKTW